MSSTLLTEVWTHHRMGPHGKKQKDRMSLVPVDFLVQSHTHVNQLTQRALISPMNYPFLLGIFPVYIITYIRVKSIYTEDQFQIS